MHLCMHTNASHIRAVVYPARPTPLHLTPLLCAAFGVVSLSALALYFLACAAVDTRP